MSVSASSELTGPIYFFGDSLTDDGNLYEATEGVVEDEVRLALSGPGGQASNGPTYAEYLDDLLGLPEGGNYAVAGAEAAGSQRLGDFIAEAGYEDALTVPESDPRLDWDINLGAQVDRFAADTAGASLENATGFILIGGNDMLGVASGASPALALVAALEATLSAATDLLDLGMGEVVIATLPMPPFFPAFGDLSPEEQEEVTALFDAYAVALAVGVEGLQAQGQDVRLLDMTPISEAILDDPAAFGLIAPYNLTLEEGDPEELAEYDEDQVAFWDPLHPSAATHGVLGAYTAYALEHEPIGLGAGSDELDTGCGSDLVLGLQGKDTLRLEVGKDLGFGGSGADTILAGRGRDLISGGSQNDLLKGQDGRDVLDGDEGADLLRGGRAADVLIDGLGSDECRGGNGADQFLFTEAELIGGTTGPDVDLFVGGEGADTLWLALSKATARKLRDELTGRDPQEALAALGIEARGIEEIRVVVGREGLAALSDEEWYAQADLWGLV